MGIFTTNKTGIDAKLNKLILNGDWGAYVDLQRKLLLSLENLRNFVKNIENHSNIDSKDIHSFGSWALSFRLTNNSELYGVGSNSERILENLKMNSQKVLEILDGGLNDNEGLIPLTKNEIKDIENLLKSNPQLPPQVQTELSKILENFVSKRLRLYENLRNILGKEDTLSLELIHVEEQSVSNYIRSLLLQAKEFDQILKENASDEAVLIKLLEITSSMEDWRSELSTQILREVKNIRDTDIRDNFSKFIENYINKYRSSIKSRISSIREVLSKYDNQFINLSGEDKEKVLNLFNEIIKDLFKGTSYESKFKDRNTSKNVNGLKAEFNTLISNLKEIISKKYTISSEKDFENLILFEGNGILKSVFSFGKNIDNEKYLTIADIRSKFNENDKTLKGFLETVIKNLKIYITDKGFSAFEKMQPVMNNFIGKEVNKVEGNKLKEKYKTEYGNRIENSTIHIQNTFSNFSSFLKEYYSIYTLKSEAASFEFIHLIPHLYDEVDNSNIESRFRGSLSFYEKLSDDIGVRLNLDIKTYSKNLNLIETSNNALIEAKNGFESDLKNIDSKIQIIKSEISNQDLQLNQEISRLEENKKINASQIQNQINSLQLRIDSISTKKGNTELISKYSSQIDNLYVQLNQILNSDVKNNGSLSNITIELTKLRRDLINKEKELSEKKFEFSYNLIIENTNNLSEFSSENKKIILEYETYNSVLSQEKLKIDQIKGKISNQLELLQGLFKTFESLKEFLVDSLSLIKILVNNKNRIKKDFFKKNIFGETDDKEIWLELNNGFTYLSETFRNADINSNFTNLIRK